MELKDDPVLYDLLEINDYKFKPERMMVFNVEAYDWNCPQHIIPRYTAEEVEEAFSSQREHVKKLEAEVKELKLKLKEKC